MGVLDQRHEIVGILAQRPVAHLHLHQHGVEGVDQLADFRLLGIVAMDPHRVVVEPRGALGGLQQAVQRPGNLPRHAQCNDQAEREGDRHDHRAHADGVPQAVVETAQLRVQEDTADPAVLEHLRLDQEQLATLELGAADVFQPPGRGRALVAPAGGREQHAVQGVHGDTGNVFLVGQQFDQSARRQGVVAGQCRTDRTGDTGRGDVEVEHRPRVLGIGLVADPDGARQGQGEAADQEDDQPQATTQRWRSQADHSVGSCQNRIVYRDMVASIRSPIN